jgi:hypothetical protein
MGTACGFANGYGRHDYDCFTKEIPMIKMSMYFITALVIGALFMFLGLSSCQKKEGPAESTGKQIDQTLENAGQKMEKAGDKIEEATKDGNKK